MDGNNRKQRDDGKQRRHMRRERLCYDIESDIKRLHWRIEFGHAISHSLYEIGQPIKRGGVDNPIESGFKPKRSERYEDQQC